VAQAPSEVVGQELLAAAVVVDFTGISAHPKKKTPTSNVAEDLSILINF
jgi:hypothetical protein